VVSSWTTTTRKEVWIYNGVHSHRFDPYIPVRGRLVHSINAVLPFDEPFIESNHRNYSTPDFKLLCWTFDLPECLGFYTYTFNSSPALTKLNLEWNRLEQYLYINSSIKYWADNHIY